MEWWNEVAGELDFGCERESRIVHNRILVDPTYRTKYGGFLHNGEIYANSNANVSIALRRIFRCAGGSLDMAATLANNQHNFISKSMPFLDSLRDMYSKDMCNYRGFLVEAEEHYADPHKKKHLREMAWKDMFETGTTASELWLKHVTYKMKKDEWAKPGKEPRMIGDLKVPASLQGFMVTKYLKKAMLEDIEYQDGILHFCATPDHGELTRVFEGLMKPRARVYMTYFSDDSCVSVNTKEGVKMYNMDISSCDASHTAMLFYALTRLADGPAGENLRVLVDQLRVPMRVYDLSRPTSGPNKRYAQFVRNDNSPVLYSGSTITTVINNLANILIGKSIIDNQASTPEEIMSAAKLAGYVVTLEECTIPEKLQFLKHSPVLDTSGTYRPVLNLGVLLRTLGTCKGDVPGSNKIPLLERFQAFERGLLQGMYPNTSFPFVDARKACVAGKSKIDSQVSKKVDEMFAYKVGETDQSTHHAVDVYARYGLSPAEIALLDEEVATSPFTSYHSCKTVSKILELDYGLRSPSVI